MATKPRLIYDNFWRKGTALTASPVAEAQHPVSDTQIDTLSMFFRASADTSPCTIPIDRLIAAPGAINFVAILGHNMIKDDADITLEGDDDIGFESGDAGKPQESRIIEYNATNIFQFVEEEVTKRYVRIQLKAKNATFAAAPQIATILCGSFFEPNQNFDAPYSQGIEDYSEIELSDSIVLFGQEKPRLKTWLLPFHGLDDASKIKVLALMDECGIHRAFVIVFNSDDANSDSHLVRLEELVAPENIHVDYWNWEMAIKEIK